MRRFMCLRYYAEAKVLRCSHLSKALVAKRINVTKSQGLRLEMLKFGSEFLG